jgi:pyruvate formate lyase activating enzyme
MEHIVPARFWHTLDDGRIQCDQCPRYCKLHEGQRGLCYIRKRDNDQLWMTSYGRSSGFCIDPIEKKPLNHFLPGTPILSFGTAGCNLACKFCQNWDMSKARDMDVLMDQATPAMLVEAAQKLGCSSLAYTYNDPVIFHEYAVDTAKLARAAGIKSVAVTAGYITHEARGEFYEYMDAANVDLKGFTEDFYWKICGAHLHNVLDTLEYLVHETKVWTEITTLLIPGENDAPKEIEEMCTWIVDHLGVSVPIHFTAFHPDYKMMDKPSTPVETLLMAHKIAKAHGIEYAYVGNVHSQAADSTYCPKCGVMVIGRDWYEITAWHLDDSGHCLDCGHQIAGLFNGPPGNWGAKRQPVRLNQSFLGAFS